VLGAAAVAAQLCVDDPERQQPVSTQSTSSVEWALRSCFSSPVWSVSRW
jgi:hypothetical protein